MRSGNNILFIYIHKGALTGTWSYYGNIYDRRVYHKTAICLERRKTSCKANKARITGSTVVKYDKWRTQTTHPQVAHKLEAIPNFSFQRLVTPSSGDC